MDSSHSAEMITAELVTDEVVDSPRADSADLPCSRVGSLRELAAIGLMVALADVTLYWGRGYAGVATFLLFAPAIFVLGAVRPHWSKALWWTAVPLALLAARVIWLGSPLRVALGVFALLAFAAAVLCGRVDLRAALLAIQAPLGGIKTIALHLQGLFGTLRFLPKGLLVSVVLPFAALLAFGTLFVLANPDVATFVSDRLGRARETLEAWLTGDALIEIAFWMLVAILTAGFLRPMVDLSRYVAAVRASAAGVARQRHVEHNARKENTRSPSAPLYAASRNVLVAVCVLFALYLAFEFKTLWLREFPPGFYYAGYAHQGAFWLTVALALATAVLSLVFRGSVLDDPRLPRLRRLAWVWCLLNGLLAVAVYNRLSIYVDFNGLTHLRIVGFFGITAVVAGFALVMWKIARGRDFAWLVSRQLTALALTVLLYALTPVDGVAVAYNVRRVLAGETSAVMQIGVKPIDTEGVLALPPLLECDDPEIRAGVRAVLAEKYDRLVHRKKRREELGWTARQLAEEHALAELEPLRGEWSAYDDMPLRKETLKRFHDYAYQWY